MYQLIQADFRFRAKVIAGIAILCYQGSPNATGNISGIHEVTGLLAITIYSDALSLGQGLGKDADDSPFSAIALPFAIHIGETEDHIVNAEYLLV